MNAPEIIRPIDIRCDMDGIAELINLAFKEDSTLTGTDILTEVRMIKKLVPIVLILRSISDTFRHIFDGYVIEDEGKMVALVNISRKGPTSKRWEIGNVATHPDYRRMGLARKLVNRAIEHARSFDAEVCTLEVRVENKPAYDLYRSLGFIHYDSLTELKLEKIPKVNPIPVEPYFIRRMRPGEWKARYELAKREVPAKVQDYMPVSKEEFFIPPVARLFDPIARWIQKEDDHRWSVEKEDQMSGYLFLGARKIEKVTHRLAIRILPGQAKYLFEPLLTLALSTLLNYPRNNTLISIRSSYKEQLAILKRYGFIIYEQTHRLGLKL